MWEKLPKSHLLRNHHLSIKNAIPDFRLMPWTGKNKHWNHEMLQSVPFHSNFFSGVALSDSPYYSSLEDFFVHKCFTNWWSSIHYTSNTTFYSSHATCRPGIYLPHTIQNLHNFSTLFGLFHNDHHFTNQMCSRQALTFCEVRQHLPFFLKLILRWATGVIMCNDTSRACFRQKETKRVSQFI